MDKNKKGQTNWGIIIFLVSFLVLTDTLFFSYANNQASSGSNLTSLNESVDSNSGFNSNQGATSGISRLKVTPPSDAPWGVALFITLINFAVVLVIFFMIRGMAS